MPLIGNSNVFPEILQKNVGQRNMDLPAKGRDNLSKMLYTIPKNPIESNENL